MKEVDAARVPEALVTLEMQLRAPHGGLIIKECQFGLIARRSLGNQVGRAMTNRLKLWR